MLYLNTMFATLTMLVVVTLVGLRVCEWLPLRLRPVARGYFSPLIGLSVFIPLATALGWMRPFSFPICLGITLAMTLYSAWSLRRWRPLLPLLAGVLAFGAVASMAALAALLRYDAFNPLTDAFTYLEHAQWLQAHAFSEKTAASGFYPAVTQVFAYQIRGHRMGASFFLAWFQALFHFEWSYYAFPGAVSVPLLAGSLATGGAVRLITRRGRLVPILTAALTATSLNGWVYGASYGFFPQTFGLAFASGKLSLLGASLTRVSGRSVLDPRPRNRIGRQFVEMLPVALVLSAFVFTYNDLLSFIAAAIALFLVGLTVIDRRLPLTALSRLAIVAIEAIVLVNVEAVRVVNNFLHTVLSIGAGTTQLGWPIRWPAWEFLALAFGLRHPIDNIWLFVSKAATVGVLMAALIGVTAAVAMRALRRQIPAPMALHVLLLGVFGAAFLYFRFFVPGIEPGEIGPTFVQFKLAKWSSISSLTLIGVAAADFFRGRATRMAGAAMCVAAIVLGISQHLAAAPALTETFLRQTGESRDGITTLTTLRQIVRTLPPNDIIYLDLGAENHKIREMVAYVLWDRKLSSNYEDDGYIAQYLRGTDRVMPYGPARWLIEFSPPDPAHPTPVARAGNLVIRPRPNVLIRPPTSTGGFGRESDSTRWWEWVERSLTLHYDVLGIPSTGRVRFLYEPATEGRTLTVTMKSVSETTFTLPMRGGWNEYVGPVIDIGSPGLTITFTSDQAGQPSGGDPRPRAFLVGNVIVEPVSPGAPSAAGPSAAWQARPTPELLQVSGGYNIEREGAGTWRYWTLKDLAFHYSVPPTMKAMRLKFTYMPAALGLNLTVHTGGPGGRTFNLPMQGGWNAYESDPLPIDGADLTISFTADGAAVRMGPNDPRMVRYLIQNLEVIPVEAAPRTP